MQLQLHLVMWLLLLLLLKLLLPSDPIFFFLLLYHQACLLTTNTRQLLKQKQKVEHHHHLCTIALRMVDTPLSKGPLITLTGDNNRVIPADHLRQTFGLIEEEKKTAFAQQVEDGSAALAVALDETGFCPIEDPRQKRDDDDDDAGGGAVDLMQFEHTVVI